MNTQIKTSSPATILIVDDNLDNLRLLSDMLSKNGYQTRRAISGTLALQSLDVTKFDLILLDINMPDINGYEVCQKLKEDRRFFHIPIIFISALNDVFDKVKAFQVGGIDYITKPFKIEEVIARVASQIKIIELNRELYETNQKLLQKNQQLQESNTRYLQNSLIDPITNFKTKISFVGQLRRNLPQYSQNNNFFAFLIIQCDRLKLYRSVLTSAAENHCLLYLSNKIKEFVPESSILGRLNETEFAVFIENININNIDNIINAIIQLQQELKLPFSIYEQEFFLNPSCGIVIGDKNYQDAEKLLCDGRYALFYAQRQGHGSYQIFDEKVKQQTINDSELKLGLIKALISNELRVDYQPFFSLEHKTVSGLEANLNWQPDINPNLSLEDLGILAAETGFTSQLNQWLLRQVCHRLQKSDYFPELDTLKGQFESPIKIRIKLSTPQFLHSELPSQVDKIIQDFSINKAHIILGITEKAIIDHPQVSLKNLRKLQQLAIKISIDCIGINYLSWSQKYNISIDNLKLDCPTFPSEELNHLDKEVYQSIINTAHCLGMTVAVDSITTAQKLSLH
ncbi:MAG: response regulator [Cyanobacteria bacterium P01_G01_bin.39]